MSNASEEAAAGGPPPAASLPATPAVQIPPLPEGLDQQGRDEAHAIQEEYQRRMTDTVQRNLQRAAVAAAVAAPPLDALAAAPHNSLLGLPEDLLHLVADALLHKHLPSALRLRQASTALRGRLAAVRAAAEARRVRWVAEVTTTNLSISNERIALKNMDGRYDWAAGPLLPTAGRVSFSVRIERSYDNSGLDILIGVCSADNTCGWGFSPFEGMLCRWTREADDHTPPLAAQLQRYYPDEECYPGEKRAPPANYPDGNQTQLMFNEAGQPANLQGSATGAVIEVVVDHSDGSLAFGINSAPPQCVPEGWRRGYDDGQAKVPFKFPQGAPLRPWAALGHKNNRIRFVRGWFL